MTSSPDGVPGTIAPEGASVRDVATTASVDPLAPARDDDAVKGTLKRLVPGFLRPRLTMNIDETFVDLIAALPASSRVLNLGSGPGWWDRWKGQRVINLDIEIGAPNLHLCADGHYLPFADGAFDAVFSNAVLEHVPKPWVMAQEMRRVIRPGGMVSVNVPFLNIIHGVTDYYRFTADGLRVLFEDFEEVKAGVSAGPSSFFTNFIPEYLSAFMPFRGLRTFARYALQGSLFWAKYLDRFIRKSDRLHMAADAFYFVGRRVR